MKRNAMSLKAIINNIAKENKVSAQSVLQTYMLERLLERISISKYKDNFILKGGLLLSSIMGIDTRTTMDMDTCIKGMNLMDEQLYEVLNEILNIDVNDGVKFEIKNSKPIREDDDYGGLKYKLLAKFDNLRVNLSIDIATGDLITPREIEYDYKMMFEDRSLKIMTYNIESIIAKKFQTVISRGILNSRMKDYYDLYYLITYEKYSKDNLKEAIRKTFKKRNTNINSIDKIIEEIKQSEFTKELWIEYTKKHQYVKSLKFEEIIRKINTISEIIL